MKKMSIGIKMIFSFALVIILFIIVSIVTLKNTKQLVENNDWVNHTHEVLVKIEMVLGDLKDAETGQRGFIITGLENYLEPYDKALLAVHKDISDLQQLTIDNDIQQQHIIKLKDLITIKLDELEITINKRRIGFEDARIVVLNDEGKEIMDDIRSVITEMKKHENKLLNERAASSEHTTINANSTTICITIAAFIIVILLIFYFTRSITSPIKKLSIIAKQIAFGNLTGEISKTDRKDEIGVLAESFNLMQQYMREKAMQANQIAKGNMLIEVKPLSNSDTMGVAFALMLNNLHSHREDQLQSIRIIEQKETYFRTVLNNAIHGIIIINEKGIIESFNLAAENIFGYTTNEVIGKNVSMLANEMDRKQHNQYLKNYLKTGIRKIIGFNREVVGIRKDGSSFPLRLGVSEIILSNRQVFMGMITDLTKEKEAESVLFKVQEQLRRTFDQAPLSIANTDLKGRFVKANPAFCDLFGYTENELLNMRFHDLTFLDDIEASKIKMRQLIDGEFHKFSLEKQYLKKNGNLIWGKVTVSVLKDKSGNTTNLIAIVEDISLRKKVEDKLLNRTKEVELSNIELEKSKRAALSIMQDAQSQRSRAEKVLEELEESNKELIKLNQAIKHSLTTVVITNKEGKIEYINPAFTTTSGYTFEDVVNHKPGILKSGKHAKEFYKDMWDTILAGETWSGDIINKKKSGEEYWESATISPIFNEEGEIVHFVAVKDDISERKLLEHELIKSKIEADKANQAKSQFLTNMSHEIRTPMNAILGFSEILSKKIKDQAQLSYLASIQSSGNILLDLINNILDLSKIESGKLGFSYEPSNIRTLFFDIESLFKLKAEEKDLLLNISISEDLPNILHIDELRIKQILINLINNSIKFTEKGSIKIKAIAANKSGDYLDLILKIEDTGVGIAADQHENVFKAFDQIDRLDNKKFEGTGLGLTITQQLVKLINGKIELKSEVGKGTMFTIVLEKVKINGSDAKFKEKLEFDSDTIRFEESTVLIVDDVKTNREVLKGFIDGFKINITEARNGQEAIESIEKYKPDLVFLDLRMPVMDGYEANEIIMSKPSWSHIPVIAITASAFDKDEAKVISLGFTGYIRKPASLNDVIKVLKKHLKYSIISLDKDRLDQSEIEIIPMLGEVLNEIGKKAMPVWKEINKLRNKKNVLVLAKVLIEIGESYKANSLLNYGKELQSAVNLFYIDKEKKLINQFPDFVKKLKS